jgi:hypothetical protein
LRIATWPAELPASFLPSRAGALLVIVGHKPIAVPEMIRACARGFNWLSCHGVAHGFQVTEHETEPVSCSSNLLSKDDRRTALLDEVLPSRPEMPLVFKPIPLTCNAERLARARASPHGSITRPSGKVKGVRPTPESCKEMTLHESAQFVGPDVFDAALIHFP